MKKLYLWKIMNYYAGSYEKIEENLFCNWNKRLSMKMMKKILNEESEVRNIFYLLSTNFTGK